MPFDPHQNIFYYYRGPSKSSDGDAILYDIQIENNTTKALINCLENSSINLLKLFLKELNIQAACSEPRYSFQVTLNQSRPDALIRLPNKLIYIESKVAAVLDKEQINNHATNIEKDALLLIITNRKEDALQVKDKNTQHVLWEDIHEIFKKYKPDNEKEKFIVNQFTEYLEVVGLSKFIGFDQNDFDYFLSPTQYYKPILKKKMSDFLAIVRASLPNKLKAQYPEIKDDAKLSGTDQVYWVAIRQKQVEGDIYNQLNFTLEITPSGIMVHTIIRNGSHKDKKPIGLFYKALCNEPDKVKKVFNSLAEDYYIQIKERIPKYGTLLKGGEIWKDNTSLVVSKKGISDQSLDFMKAKLEEIDLPGIQIGATISRGDQRLSSPKELADFAINVIEKCSGFIDLIKAQEK